MELKYALFLALAVAVLGGRCILYWALLLKKPPSLLGMFIIGIVLFGASVLFLLFASESLLAPVALVFAAIVLITAIGIWITGG